MKIKERPKKPVKKGKAYFPWLVEEAPRKSGRLAQLNKHNRKDRRPSEFVRMAREIEDEPTRIGLLRR